MPVERLIARLKRRLLPGTRRPASIYPEQFAPNMDLPRCDGPPRIYLIATTPRCGSHFLGHALAGSGHFGVPLEYFHQGNLDAWRDRFGVGEVDDVLMRLLEVRSGPTGWFGFKAHWPQFAPVSDGRLFEPHGGLRKAVWIYRRDLPSQAISFLVAGQTGKWISGAAATGQARYDYAAIVARARRIDAQNRSWAQYFAGAPDLPVHRVAYEDVLADEAAQFAGITGFLDPQADVRLARSERTQRQANSQSAEWRTRFENEITAEDRWILDVQDWDGRASP